MAWVGQEQGSWEHAQPYIDENPDYNFVPPGPARLGFEDSGDSYVAFALPE